MFCYLCDPVTVQDIPASLSSQTRAPGPNPPCRASSPKTLTVQLAKNKQSGEHQAGNQAAGPEAGTRCEDTGDQQKVAGSGTMESRCSDAGAKARTPGFKDSMAKDLGCPGKF